MMINTNQSQHPTPWVPAYTVGYEIVDIADNRHNSVLNAPDHDTMRFIIAAVNACRDIPVEQLEGRRFIKTTSGLDWTLYSERALDRDTPPTISSAT